MTTITCRETDDPAAWAEKLNAASAGDEFDGLLDQMICLEASLRKKGIPTSHISDRINEGVELRIARFGEDYVPF